MNDLSPKNGFFPIANKLAELLGSISIPGSEMRILWAVWRKTWGWEQNGRRKDFDQIALSQFTSFTGMKHVNVVRSIQSLVAKRLLLKTDKGYGFNRNYEEWLVVKRLPRSASSQKDKSDSQLATEKSSQLATKISSQKTIYKRKKEKKETIQKTGDEVGQARLVRDIIEAFGGINPACKKMYGNITQRQACIDLIETYTFERVMIVITKTLPKTNGLEFFPTITTPHQLFESWTRLEAAVMRYKSKGVIKKPNFY